MKRALTIALPLLLGLLLFQLFPGSLSLVSAQKQHANRGTKSGDLGQLRRDLVAAVGKDFEVVKDEMKGRSNASGGGTYWLAHLKPKHPGSFKLIYRYNYNDPLYSHVEREFGLNIGSKGCRRGAPNAGSYRRFCVGDTIILPVAIYNFTEHEFSLSSQQYTPEDDAVWEKVDSASVDVGADQSPVKNPLAEQLKYVGSSSNRLLHRNGGYTLESYAVFEAQNPGRFNVTVSAVYPEVPAAELSGIGAGIGVPIIVVSRGTPVTLLASQHEVRGYTMGFNGKEYVSSVSGDAYMADLMILQPGDRISLKYFTAIRSRDYERRERAANDSPGSDDLFDKVPSPIIYKNPFALNTEYNFTEWLADHLPR
ncbi:MAG TPA: hypothetical protein VGO56_08020 [Pyrinomonadaceae bacterium]|jgi:hypothetical protein|nr:hypothetical protein [Pyrinomonadaceae bacterium]